MWVMMDTTLHSGSWLTPPHHCNLGCVSGTLSKEKKWHGLLRHWNLESNKSCICVTALATNLHCRGPKSQKCLGSLLKRYGIQKRAHWRACENQWQMMHLWTTLTTIFGSRLQWKAFPKMSPYHCKFPCKVKQAFHGYFFDTDSYIWAGCG